MASEIRADPSRRLSPKSIPFYLFHAAALALFPVFGWSFKGALLAAALYAVRMFAVTGGYHRYFSHRTYKTSRVFQFVLALLAMTSLQKGVIWWASHHRAHHKNSDTPDDVHSALRDGFWWSHVGWILAHKYDAIDEARVRDLLKYPELRLLEWFHPLPAIVMSVGLYLAAGWWAVYWGLLVSTTLLWHGTFTINSLTHIIGKRRYATSDNSRNHWALALITLGEGWHNNHHYYQRATNQGFFWWEIDVTYYVLRALSFVGLVWDLHTPPRHVREANRIDRGASATPELEAVRVPPVAPPVPGPAE
jgi:stearoyl-CoA desaturase (Delta-9 desaturase)